MARKLSYIKCLEVLHWIHSERTTKLSFIWIIAHNELLNLKSSLVLGNWNIDLDDTVDWTEFNGHQNTWDKKNLTSADLNSTQLREYNKMKRTSNSYTLQSIIWLQSCEHLWVVLRIYCPINVISSHNNWNWYFHLDRLRNRHIFTKLLSGKPLINVYFVTIGVFF